MKKVKYYIVLENIVTGGRSMEKERELIEESVSKEIDLSKEEIEGYGSCNNRTQNVFDRLSMAVFRCLYFRRRLIEKKATKAT